MPRYALMLAHEFLTREQKKKGLKPKAEKTPASLWAASEKIDGMRFFWDGGATNGVELGEVPWANNTHIGRYTLGLKQVCTGLWSRYMNPIMAHQDWLAETGLLHCRFLLDGEIAGYNYGEFQKTMSVTRSLAATAEDWSTQRPYIFDMPSEWIVNEGEIYVSGNETYKIRPGGRALLAERGVRGTVFGETFASRMETLRKGLLTTHLGTFVLKQNTFSSWAEIADWSASRMALGCEGAIIRRWDSSYEFGRSHSLLKVVDSVETEVRVVGSTEGEGWAVGGVGAYVVEGLAGTPFAGRTWKVASGLTKEMRFGAVPVGQVYTVCFKELTDDGLPRGGALKTCHGERREV